MTDTTDPFEQLAALGASEVTMSRAFAADLRRRVARALGAPTTTTSRFDLAGTPRAGTPRGGAPASSAHAIRTTASEPDRSTTMSQPAASQVITPYLCVHDATAAIEWYQEYFGASVANVIPWEGRVGHAEFDVSGAKFYLSDEAHELGVYAPERDGSRSSVSIVLQVAVVDEFIERAVRGGAVLSRPIEEAHGSRSGWLVDPFGHRWNVGTPVYDEAALAERIAPAEPYYLTVTTGDVETAAAFYGAVLRWEYSDPNPAGGRHVENTDMPIGIRPRENEFSQNQPGEIELWWTVRDFDDAVERVRVAGGTVVEINRWDSGREAICEDDQGVTFKMSEPAPGYDRT